MAENPSTTLLYERHQPASTSTGELAVEPVLPPKEHTQMYNIESQAVNIENERMHGELEQKQARIRELEETAEGDRKRAEEAEMELIRAQQERQSALADCHHYREELFRVRPAVCTVLRLRPGNDRDQDNEPLNLESPDQSKYRSSVVLRAHQFDNRQTNDIEYTFDRIFHQTDTNETVYEYIKPLVQAALEEVNVGIFLDGPSGSGKTYTLLEPPNGIAFLLAQHIFQYSCSGEGRPRALEVKFLVFKIYMEKLYEAKDQNCSVPLFISDAQWGVFSDKQHRAKIEGQKTPSATDLMSKLQQIYRTRDKCSTKQNETSSRGHTVCMIEISSTSLEGKEATSRLSLVDLAGPESSDDSPNPRQTTCINQGRGAILDQLSDMIRLHQPNLKSAEKKKGWEALRRNAKNSPVCNVSRQSKDLSGD